MVCLNNNKKLPDNAEWAYLYAIADIYENYSSPYYDKKDKEAPHPLTDTEVTQILSDKYNLKNVHRNTVANTRKKLEQYFGFEFAIKKKGRYLKKHSNGLADENNLILLSFIIKNSPLLSKDRAAQLISSISYLAISKTIKKTIEHIKDSKGQNKTYDYFEKVILLLDAINKKQMITFDHINTRYRKVEPLEIRAKGDILLLDCYVPRRWMSGKYIDSFNINNLYNIARSKKGRPKKDIV